MYAARTHPSEGELTRLWAKSLALESGPGRRIVIVTTDEVGIPRGVADEVAARVEKQYALKRSRFLVNASHTHTCRVVWPNMNLTVFPPGEPAKLLDYQRTFTDAVAAPLSPAGNRERGQNRRRSQRAGRSYRTGPENYSRGRRGPRGALRLRLP